VITELTQSSIGMFFRCAAQFEKRYVNGIIIPPGVAARTGSGVHAGAEHNYRSVVDNGEPAPLDEVQDVTHDRFVKLVVDEGCWFSGDEVSEKKRILGEGLDSAIAMSTFYHQQFAPLDREIALVEERLYADLGFGIPVSGKPDLIADGVLRDIKTSGKRWAAGREDEEIQPTLYRMLLRDNGFGNLPAEYRIITKSKKAPKDNAAIWDEKTGVCGEIRRAERTPEHEKALKARVKTMVDMLSAGTFPPSSPGTWWCSPKWCGYHSICPYVKGKIIDV